MQGAALGDLIFMVWEDQVLTAAVNIEGITKIFGAHRRTFNMPARTALAPWRLPIWFAWLCALPERKIERILLLFIHFHAGAGKQVIDIAAGKLTIVAKFAYGIIHIAIIQRVGIALVNEPLHKSDDVIDVLTDLWMHRRRQHIQRLGVFEKGVDIERSKRDRIFPFFIGAIDDLVVHIGKVGHKSDIVAEITEITAHRVEHNDRTGVAEMNVVVGGWAADVHFHLTWLQRLKWHFFLRQGIVNHDLVQSFSSNSFKRRLISSRRKPKMRRQSSTGSGSWLWLRSGW